MIRSTAFWVMTTSMAMMAMIRLMVGWGRITSRGDRGTIPTAIMGEGDTILETFNGTGMMMIKSCLELASRSRIYHSRDWEPRRC